MAAPVQPPDLYLDTELRVRNRGIRIELDVPQRLESAEFLLPTARRLANRVIQIAVEDVAAAGEPISCKAGCGACCKQLVPILPSEARRIAKIVDEMPQPRQGVIRERFAQASQAMQAAKIDAALRSAANTLTPDEANALGMKYFEMGVSCPFLEEGSCSIYEERPLICREYLVSSPASECEWPTAEKIKKVAIPAKVAQAAMQLEQDAQGRRWVALTHSLDYAQTHPEPTDRVSAPELVTRFFNALADAKLPAGPGMGR
ncbi:YkgJ family cysteine cluster protein [Piscinibacterium candidicorallinum]|uniref:YkgJ family cysteine cluster protein n=1 Tax=Piscinibacterium candidicorallinum TaxID=1793872 RepID=A0ABV7H5D0_9BURK